MGAGNGKPRGFGWGLASIASLLVLLVFAIAPAHSAAVEVDNGSATRLGTVEPGFISFGIDASQLYERNSGTPFDFGRPRLMTLARALAPAVIRYSGTKIETTYYDDTDTLGPGDAPEGYDYVLRRSEWVDALEFARDAGFDVMASTSVGPGPRLPGGNWDPANARELFQRAKTEGLAITDVQLGNEPNLTVYGSGLGTDYTAADYARDVADFLELKAELMPDSRFVGPGPFFTTGAERPLYGARLGPDVSEIMAATGSVYDVVSYHQYPAFGDSAKCLSLTPRLPADTLAPSFLDLPAGAHDYMAGLRDQYAPGKPLWIDESSNTACGGIDEYSDKFISTFYYLNSLGYLAQRGVGLVSRWTLSGPQPYALIDDSTLTPRADYWAALLWRKLMGRQVLEPAVTEPSPDLRVYSHCLADGAPGGVATLLLNTGRTAPVTVDLGATPDEPAGLYQVTGELTGDQVALNGTGLATTPEGALPAIEPVPATGPVTVPPASYAFVTSPSAAAYACGGPKPKQPLRLGLKAPKQSLGKIARTGRIKATFRMNLNGHGKVVASIGKTRIGSVSFPAAAGRSRALLIKVRSKARKRFGKVRKPSKLKIRLIASGTSPEAISGKTVRIPLKLKR